MYSPDPKPLKTLLDTLVSLPYIERVDVFDNHQQLIAQSLISTAATPYFNQQDIINIFRQSCFATGIYKCLLCR